MKILIQRVAHASVVVEGKTIGSIGPGAVVFFGATHGDSLNEIQWMANKLINLRMFEDAQGKTNESLLDKKGEILIISQFTLYADCTVGRRPSFTQAAPPELAKQLYSAFIAEVRNSGLVVQSGLFGAEMQVSLLNEGPFTLCVERAPLH